MNSLAVKFEAIPKVVSSRKVFQFKATNVCVFEIQHMAALAFERYQTRLLRGAKIQKEN
jgi:hypothetical protein